MISKELHAVEAFEIAQDLSTKTKNETSQPRLAGVEDNESGVEQETLFSFIDKKKRWIAELHLVRVFLSLVLCEC